MNLPFFFIFVLNVLFIFMKFFTLNRKPISNRYSLLLSIRNDLCTNKYQRSRMCNANSVVNHSLLYLVLSLDILDLTLSY